MLLELSFAILNRARGTKLFDRASSTTVARLVSACAMALIAGMASGSFYLILWLIPSLYLWMVLGWGKYVGAAIGQPINQYETEVRLIDWLMYKFPFTRGRLWGVISLSMRMSLAIPCVLGAALITGGNPLWVLLVPFLSIPYLLAGLAEASGAWALGEYASGFMLGFILAGVVGG